MRFLITVLLIALLLVLLMAPQFAEGARMKSPRSASSSKRATPTSTKKASSTKKAASTSKPKAAPVKPQTTTKPKPAAPKKTTTTTKPKATKPAAQAPPVKPQPTEEQRMAQYYEERYKEYQKALPSPDDNKQLVATGHDVETIKSMNVAKLRRYLKDREAVCPGCVEKFHLVERAMQVRGWETEEDRIAKELTPSQQSVDAALSPHHLSGGLPVDATGKPVVATTQDQQQIKAIQLSHGIECTEALYNGTQYCTQNAASS